MMTYAVKLAQTPEKVVASDVDALRAAGLEDREVLDLVQVVAYFNYISTLITGLGIPA